MEENKNTNTTANYAALRKAVAAGAVVIIGGMAYYVTAWKIKHDLIEPSLKTCMEAGEEFLNSWASKKQ